MKRMIYRIGVLVLLAVLLPMTVSAAEVPYKTYTISGDYEELESPAAYIPSRTVNSDLLQLETPITAPSDMLVYGEHLYLLDSGSNRVLVLDREYKVVRQICEYPYQGQMRAFKKPEGLTVSPVGELYVADTENRCIVKMTLQGELLAVFEAPEIKALGEYKFAPLKLGVDDAERIYVIAQGINRGLMVLDADGKFVKFSGTPRVTYDLFTMLWKTLLPRSSSQSLEKFVPTEFSNLHLDAEGFIYTTIKANDSEALFGAIAAKDQESVKVVQRFNTTDQDVLRRFGQVPIVGDVNWKLPSKTVSGALVPEDSTEGASTIEDIVVDELGCYYCVDSYRGRIFAYDNDGNLLYAFGGKAGAQGNVQTASAIELFGDELLVLDRAAGHIVCYQKTDYGTALQTAALLFGQGQYRQAMEKWEEVSRYNGNLTLAYVGIGKCAYRLGDYQKAMQYLRLAGEKEYYSKAYQAARAEAIDANFIWIFIGVVALLVLFVLYAFGVFERKTPKKEVDPRLHPTRSGLRYALHLVIHPFAGFYDLKHERRGNLLSGTVLLALAVVAHLISQQYSGYLFSTYDPATYNVLTEILSVLLPVLLWVLANWCLTTLMDGEGNMKDVYIATTYALTPMILILPVLTAVSNVMSLGESSYYNFFMSLTFVWVGLLIFFGTMITHQYSLLKTLFTCLLILVGIIIILFIGILFYNLIQRIISFVLSSWQEISFHISG